MEDINVQNTIRKRILFADRCRSNFIFVLLLVRLTVDVRHAIQITRMGKPR